MNKRLLNRCKCFFMSLLMIISVLNTTAVQSASAYTSHSCNEAVAWAKAQIGKLIDIDGAYGAQCVDLIMAYYQYLGVSRVSGNGCDYSHNSLPSGWTRIQNTSTFVPNPGDIVVWTDEGWKNGHVAIFLSGDTNNFTSIDQNWPKGSAVKEVSHSYKYVWGVIRPDFSVGIPPIPPVIDDDPSPPVEFTGNSTETENEFYAFIQNTNSNRYLQNAGGNVQLAENNVNDNTQIWKFVRNSDTSYTIRNVNNNTVIDAEGATITPGSNIMSHEYNGGDNQKWYLINYNGATHIISKMDRRRSIDVAFAGTDAGTNVRLDKWNLSGAQCFNIVKLGNEIDVRLYLSKLGSGYSADDAKNKILASGMMSDNTYLWYDTVYKNTGTRIDAIGQYKFNADISVNKPNGSTLFTYRYSNSGTNWYRFKMTDLGTYTCKCTLSGGLSKTVTIYHEALYNADYLPSKFDNDIDQYIFDARYYVSGYKDLQDTYGMDPDKLYRHWKDYGIKEGRSASPYFDLEYYRNVNNDLRNAFGTDYQKYYDHFVSYGITHELRSLSPVLDLSYYKKMNEDFANMKDGKELLRHMYIYGAKEGRNSSPSFDANYYLNFYTDVKDAAPDKSYAYFHYMCYGRKEGRFGIKPPEITQMKVTNLTSDGFNVYLKVKPNAAIHHIDVNVWTAKDGQDDKKVYKATLNANNEANVSVKRPNHKNEYGTYYIHTYAYDIYNNYGFNGLGTTVKLDTYVITYNMNGGSPTINSQVKTQGQDLTLSNTIPTKKGHSFVGWSTSSTATTAQYQAGSKYTANSSATLYAVWKPDTYTISYNLNGGSGSIANQTKTYGQDLTLSTTIPTRDNYGFAGWSTSSTATTAQYQAGSKYTANSSATLYAVWTPNKYTISYNMNGGNGTIANQTKTYGQDLTLSSKIPTRTGHSFVGWSTSSNATTAQYQAGGKYTNNSSATLYAVWKPDTYTITYHVNDGSGKTEIQIINYGQSCTISSKIPRRTGYTFVGWSTSSTATTAQYQAGSKYTVNSSANLYAVWTPNKYTISYNLNGGSGTIASQTKTYGQDLTLSSIVPTRPDYLFIGWSIDKNATTAQYQPGSKYTNDSSVTLYAVWKVNHSYTTKVIAPTCTEQGYTLHTCANCGDSYKDTYTDAVGHKYVESVIAPTESAQGYTLHTCSVCGDSYKDNYTDVLKPDDPNAPQIVVDNKTIGSGKEVIVSVSLKNNPGIMALKFNVSYDSNVMTIVNAESVGINALYSQRMTDNPFVVSWESGDHDIDTNGEIVKLTFMVNENANEGTYPITITYDEDNIYNLKEENIHFDVVNGSVTVSEYLPGDINNDGKVNMKDLTRLHQYINGWDVTVNESAKDVNGDGKVNMKDLTRLHQFINGWDVTIY